MTMDYIRATYNVPAKGGGRIRYSGGPMIQEGTIVGCKGCLLRIRMDGSQLVMKYHPTWKMEYLPQEGDSHD